MPNGNLVKVRLDSKHCRAICAEIGDRLRYALSKDTPALPLRLRLLLDRLEELDRQAPSIVPSVEDMQWRAAADVVRI